MAQPTVSAIPPRQAVVGRYAECSVNGIVLALLFDWRVGINTSFFDVTGHGETYKRWKVADVEWTAEAQGYLLPGGAGTYLTLAYNREGPVALHFAGYEGPAEGAPGREPVLLFEGDCFAMEGEISAPMSMVTQRLRFQGDGFPGVTPRAVPRVGGPAPLGPPGLPQASPGAPGDPSPASTLISGSSPVSGGGVRVGPRR